MTVVLASNNSHKVTEVKEKLTLPGVRVLSLAEAEIEVDVEETGTTFAENAALKAQTIAAMTSLPVLADDSGLIVDALDGAPGVYSARYAGEHGNDAANNIKLLKELEGVDDRSAAFVCVLALCREGRVEYFEGRCEGVIAHEPQGSLGFGYDPLFFLPDRGCTMAELPLEEKNLISHRARALDAFAAYLRGKHAD